MTLVSVAAAMATPNPLAIAHVHGMLLDNSCRHSVEKAKFALSTALYDAPHAALLHKLSDLPDADEEILVNRTVDGCPAPVVVMRNVSSRLR